jgi:hypothetical protein
MIANMVLVPITPFNMETKPANRLLVNEMCVVNGKIALVNSVEPVDGNLGEGAEMTVTWHFHTKAGLHTEQHTVPKMHQYQTIDILVNQKVEGK